mgnify:CR=1 FL=1
MVMVLEMVVPFITEVPLSGTPPWPGFTLNCNCVWVASFSSGQLKVSVLPDCTGKDRFKGWSQVIQEAELSIVMTTNAVAVLPPLSVTVSKYVVAELGLATGLGALGLFKLAGGDHE